MKIELYNPNCQNPDSACIVIVTNGKASIINNNLINFFVLISATELLINNI